MSANDYRYCPYCGHELETRQLFGADRGYCPACGFIHFRDPKLAAGALIVEAGRVLLVRRDVVPRKGFWAMPSGFVEYDEQPRDALAREIREETGLEAEIGRIIDVYPIADPNKPGVFLLFEARILGGQLQPGDDVSEVQWFPIDDIPWEALAFPQLKEVLAHETH
ncbi:MAG TPA: NUDIX domain-containing protein [Anaerolineae bacterium]|nr:NUDIX domain-containing protein [Anaerolineae bacterium]